MNRAKPTTVRRPSAAAKPSGHPPPGDFIALGSKGQTTESKTASTLLKPAPSGLPSERKRDAAAALAGASALPGLTKRPKLSSTPPLSALGRLAEAAVAEKRAISPSIKEPSVVPIEGKDSFYTSPREHSPCLVRAPGFRKATSKLRSVGSLENGGQESAVSLFFRASLIGPPSLHLCFRLTVMGDSRAGASYIGKPCTGSCRPCSRAGAGGVQGSADRQVLSLGAVRVMRTLSTQEARDYERSRGVVAFVLVEGPALGPGPGLLWAAARAGAVLGSGETRAETGPGLRWVAAASDLWELLNAHKDNLGTTIKFVIFNELSNARNPNNMQILYTVLQPSSGLAPKVGPGDPAPEPLEERFLAMVFQDLLTNKDDYLRASRALLREIIKQTKHEINFQAFCLGLMQERKEPQYLDMEFKHPAVLLAVVGGG
ncbi:PREDICTED: integrator complex subunit 1-like [Bison bison bison]|uniref:Integrator complex subunit 1-like n=1 Tax=Bison bison bison TaxID=43346 RepID=A0A6P3HB88_BISBB|nr:PREDICTED: integrator complex subunit 1-like [Bison bison bison]